VLVKNNIFVLL